MDSLLRRRNGSEDIIITKFGQILLKFAIVFKIFEYFCRFLSLTIITGQQNFWSLADGLHDNTPETKMVLTIFLTIGKFGNFFFDFSTFSFLYYLNTNKARKLKLRRRISSWKSFLTLSLSLLIGISFLLFLVHVLISRALSLSLFLSLSLSLTLYWCRTSAAVMWRDVIIYTFTSRHFN